MRRRNPMAEDVICDEQPERHPTQRQQCLFEVMRRSGQTAAEIAVAAGLRRHAPSRRLPELQRSGCVAHGPVRVCSVTGKPSKTWLPTREVLS